MNVPNTNKSARNHAAALRGVAFLLLAAVSTGLCQPVITTQPSSLTNIAGTTATFSVEATGAEALHYQWQFNTLERTDQTNAILVLTNVHTGTAGSYTVVI